MPNWTTNELRVSGKTADIKRFITKVRGNCSVFSLDRILPMPKVLRGISSGHNKIGGLWCNRWRDLGPSGAPEPISEAEQKSIEKITGGCTTWYDWCCKNWGTKWDTVRAEAPHKHIGKHESWVIYKFNTAWGAPMPVLIAVSKLFPDVSLELYCEDEGSDEWYKITINNGKESDGSTGPIGEEDEDEKESI